MDLMQNVVKKLGKTNYTIDSSLSYKDKWIVLFEKGICFLRGLYYRIWLKKCDGFLFVGRNCKLRFLHKITMGKTIIIGDHVEINGLCKKGITIGNNVSIHRNTIIECTGVLSKLGEGLAIGNNVGIAQNVFIQVRGFVQIGSNSMFGPGSSLFSENHCHDLTGIPMIKQPTIRKGVIVEDDVWVGAKAVILDGVTIGKGSIIAAGCVVLHDVPAYSIVAGVPGRIIGCRS
ncbi:MAG TPA: DapH/DapD/GlmU-related protein [Flavitalea sp.]|nr:DapH/DapD/GlmU-related protein [Flavitalea sp.]